ncbi:MAG TPA: MobP3 family relaxase, partial [Spirochaetales bacterium]|nr:MobP3 family relaxase [Spirochaetales bacterium]
MKNAPKAHLANLVEYVATREGVEKVSDSSHLLPATKNQQQLISEILKMLPDTADLFEYEDYLKKPTRENASEFISIALENNLDLIGKKKNFVDYIANRPRVEKFGSHGLFTDEGVPVVLSKVADEVSNHSGNVWTNIVSLRREDAERLGYDCAKPWQDLIRAQRNIIAENMKIAPENLRWYAAFHNESHHPHIHLIAYSINPQEAYVTKQGIENMRGSL